jgi:glycerol-3-phosphate dehydrogenase
VRPPGKDGATTKSISRNHEILVSEAGLVTVVGGKWTTYRKMAEDTLDKATVLAGLEDKPCVTEKLQLLGWRSPNANPLPDWLGVYGSEAEDVQALIASDASLGEMLHPRLPYPLATIVWAVRHEQALTLEDALSRRTRALLLDAQAAIEAAPAVARAMARELGHREDWVESQIAEFTKLANGYLATKAR